MLFRPNGPFEYSGTVITTCLNNVSSLSILWHIVRGYKPLPRADALEWVRSRLGSLGWVVTIEECIRFEQVQFLKCSPARSVSGRWLSCLNLGVIFRAFGKTTRDYPGSGDLVGRIKAFNAGVVAGLKFAGEHPLMWMLRKKFPLGKSLCLKYSWEHLGQEFSSEELDADSVMARYEIGGRVLGVGDLECLLDLLWQSSLGDLIIHPVVDAAMQLDYGVGRRDCWGGPDKPLHLGNYEYSYK